MNYVVNIDLGDGRTDSVRVTPNTNLSVLAARFRMKHNLPSEIESTLIQEIQRNCLSCDSSPTKPESHTSSAFSTHATTADKTPEKPLFNSKDFANPGARLYEKGIRYLEIISRKVEKFRKMKEENEDRNLTFTPKINSSACRSSVEKLLRSGTKTEEKLEKMRGEKLNREINECTFSPTISRSSSRKAEKRRKSLTPDRWSVKTGSSSKSSYV